MCGREKWIDRSEEAKYQRGRDEEQSEDEGSLVPASLKSG